MDEKLRLERLKVLNTLCTDLHGSDYDLTVSDTVVRNRAEAFFFFPRSGCIACYKGPAVRPFIRPHQGLTARPRKNNNTATVRGRHFFSYVRL